MHLGVKVCRRLKVGHVDLILEFYGYALTGVSCTPAVHFISSPEPKVQVRYSDRHPSVVCCALCVVRKLFTFSTSPLKPLGQFQSNLAEIIIGGWEFKFVQMVPLVPRVLDLRTQKGQSVLFLLKSSCQKA